MMKAADLPPQPVVSAIIVNWNTRNHLKVCLDSLLADGGSRDLEVIVVDNNSADGSADMVQQEYPAASLVRSPRNFMFAGGVNKGLECARGEYLLILNPDIIMTRQKIIELARYLRSHPDIAAISPRLVSNDGKTQTEYFLRLPRLAQLLFFYSFLNPLSRRSPSLRQRYYECPLNPEGETDVEQLPGACMMVPRKMVDKAGLMDEDFTLYYEDVDWCKRLSRYGRLVTHAQTSVEHYGGGSHEEKEYWIYGRFRVSMLLYFRKHLGKGNFFAARAIFLGALYPAFLIRLVQRFLPFVDRSRNKYHIDKYKFFLREYKERRSSFAKY